MTRQSDLEWLDDFLWATQQTLANDSKYQEATAQGARGVMALKTKDKIYIVNMDERKAYSGNHPQPG